MPEAVLGSCETTLISLSLLSYVFDELAERGITSETPTQWQLDDRVRAHLVALDVVLTTLR